MTREKVLQRVSSFRHKVSNKSKYLYYLDLGRAEINVHHDYKRSKLGVFISIIVIIIVAFFVIITVSQFSKGIPSIIYNADVPSSYQPMMTPMVGVVLLRGNKALAMDPSMVTVLFRYMTITDQDQQPRKIEIVKGVKCTFYDNPLPNQPDQINVYTTEAICPEKPVQMTGSYEMQTYQYLDIGIHKCFCQPNDTNCQCSSQNDFNSFFYNDTAINLLVVENIPSYSVFPRRFDIFPRDPDYSQAPTVKNYTKSLFWYNSKIFYQKVDVTVKRKTIYNAPRFIFDYKFGDFFVVGSSTARANDVDINATLLYKAYIRLDEYENNEFRQSQQLLNMVASWGALWTFFSLTVLQLVALYNKKKYEHEKKLSEMVNGVMKSSSSNANDVELELRSKPPQNILNASSSASLETFGWSPNHNNSSFTLTTSNDLNSSGQPNHHNHHHNPHNHRVTYNHDTLNSTLVDSIDINNSNDNNNNNNSSSANN